ncbi:MULTISPECIES: PspC domain-containing protein [Weeksella]|uniref:PspC domain-containing protein n=1 Tax=Weeksella TaxID=1013 RepID=UPI0008A21F68|nr:MULTISPECIES: PspC domain-containing protein [Weeksella]MDK7375651.1 PspC domain-containing protein [Weeksella virosa]OFM82387.1 hypothetical protein HMPREF2660_04445 [Weeksella sp. HMSC059D05]
MDKTISISLGGFSFIVNEEAYHQLRRYLEDIKQSLQGTEGVEDIIEDVEQRIAELLRERLQYKEVVNDADIAYVISVMGRPEQYMVDDEFSYQEESTTSNESKEETAGNPMTKKRLFRDPDDKIISGLCSGLAHYLGLDPWAVRAVWFILLMLGIFTGVSTIMVLFAYFLMVMFIPKAETFADKMAMYGKAANFEQIKENALKASETLSKSGRKIGDNLGSLFQVLTKIAVFIIGILFVVFGLSFIFGGISVYFISWFNIPAQYFDYFVEEDWLSKLILFCSSLLLILPGALSVMLGIKFIKPTFRINKNILISTIVLWFIALFGIIIIGVYTAKGYANSVEKVTMNTLAVTNDTLQVKFEAQNRGNYRFKIFDEDERPFYIMNDELFVTIDRRIEIRESKDNAAHLQVTYKARGANGVDAKNNLDAIRFNYQVRGNQLVLDDFLSAGKNSTFRMQAVRFVLYVPRNKYVKLDPSIEYAEIISNNSNTAFYSNINDQIFGYNGIKFVCLNCDNESDNDSDYDNHHGIDTMDISEKGIHIQSKKGDKISIDKNKIHISDDTDTLNINYGNHQSNR